MASIRNLCGALSLESVAELRARAAQAGIENHARLNKRQLCETLAQRYNEEAVVAEEPEPSEFFLDPVDLSTLLTNGFLCTVDGYTYAPETLRNLLTVGGGTAKSPMVPDRTFTEKDLVPNITLRKVIRQWLEVYGSSYLAPDETNRWASIVPPPSPAVSIPASPAPSPRNLPIESSLSRLLASRPSSASQSRPPSAPQVRPPPPQLPPRPMNPPSLSRPPSLSIPRPAPRSVRPRSHSEVYQAIPQLYRPPSVDYSPYITVPPNRIQSALRDRDLPSIASLVQNANPQLSMAEALDVAREFTMVYQDEASSPADYLAQSLNQLAVMH